MARLRESVTSGTIERSRHRHQNIICQTQKKKQPVPLKHTPSRSRDHATVGKIAICQQENIRYPRRAHNITMRNRKSHRQNEHATKMWLFLRCTMKGKERKTCWLFCLFRQSAGKNGAPDTVILGVPKSPASYVCLPRFPHYPDKKEKKNETRDGGA